MSVRFWDLAFTSRGGTHTAQRFLVEARRKNERTELIIKHPIATQGPATSPVQWKLPAKFPNYKSWLSRGFAHVWDRLDQGLFIICIGFCDLMAATIHPPQLGPQTVPPLRCQGRVHHAGHADDHHIALGVDGLLGWSVFQLGDLFKRSYGRCDIHAHILDINYIYMSYHQYTCI